jgi:hypothetical protein
MTQKMKANSLADLRRMPGNLDLARRAIHLA